MVKEMAVMKIILWIGLTIILVVRPFIIHFMPFNEQCNLKQYGNLQKYMLLIGLWEKFFHAQQVWY